MTGSMKLCSAEMKGKTATVLEASPVFSLYDLHAAQCVSKGTPAVQFAESAPVA